jgi:hypothetical protein
VKEDKDENEQMGRIKKRRKTEGGNKSKNEEEVNKYSQFRITNEVEG